GVEVRGFGGFYKKHRKARLGINPKTSERTQVGEKFVPFFKPGKSLREAVDNQ
ncbi:MAG TPA: integration host factor subunit beta, partial [Gammaproteobacteria bacterium]|nr:integration host factor subunit beta [Gammaproteobacteria bacterium]